MIGLRARKEKLAQVGNRKDEVRETQKIKKKGISMATKMPINLLVENAMATLTPCEHYTTKR